MSREDIRVDTLLTKRSWTKDETAHLIAKYESYPELWNSSIRDYKDRHKKFLASKTIAAYFNTTPSEISRKVHNLRCQMSNEIRKAKKYDRSHATRGVYVSSWEFYNSMKFMIAGAAYNDYEFPEDNEENYQQSDVSNPYESKASSSVKIEKKVRRNRFKSPTIDDDQVFGNFVASKLRNMRSDIHRRKLKRMIQKEILQVCYGETSLEPNDETDSKHHFTCFSNPIPVYNSSPVHYSDDTSK